MNPATHSLRILQVATSDLAGGAERSATNLLEAFRRAGHESWMAVGTKRTGDSGTFEIPNAASRNAWVRSVQAWRDGHAADLGRIRGAGRATALLRDLGQPWVRMNRELGYEEFDFPGTARLLDLPPSPPDIVHCHNLHGAYFDLRELPRLSAAVPMVLNLRDAWLLSGHCAFSFECMRWKSGCGACPDLGIYPAIKRDGSARNWRRKAGIFGRSKVHVATPSQWLMDKAKESMLWPACIGHRVIPNGVDISVFQPGDKAAARDALGIPRDARVLMFAANGIRHNVWKDYRTLTEVINTLGARADKGELILLAVGEEAPDEQRGRARIRFVPFQSRHADMVRYYQAADLYVHAAHLESFGNVLLEARACGTPVVASAVGGIPEHVRSAGHAGMAPALNSLPSLRQTGILTPAGNSEAMARAIADLLDNPPMLAELSRNSVLDMREHFSVGLQASRFLDWYREILGAGAAAPPKNPSLRTA